VRLVRPALHLAQEVPFTWRKKWESDWDNVRYCSDACRRRGPVEPSAVNRGTRRSAAGGR